MQVCNKCKIELKMGDKYGEERIDILPYYCISISKMGGLQNKDSLEEIELCPRCRKNLIGIIKRWLNKPYKEESK